MNKRKIKLIVNIKDIMLFIIAFCAIMYLPDIRHKLLGVVLAISVMTR